MPSRLALTSAWPLDRQPRTTPPFVPSCRTPSILQQQRIEQIRPRRRPEPQLTRQAHTDQTRSLGMTRRLPLGDIQRIGQRPDQLRQRDLAGGRHHRTSIPHHHFRALDRIVWHQTRGSLRRPGASERRDFDKSDAPASSRDAMSYPGWSCGLTSGSRRARRLCLRTASMPASSIWRCWLEASDGRHPVPSVAGTRIPRIAHSRETHLLQGVRPCSSPAANARVQQKALHAYFSAQTATKRKGPRLQALSIAGAGFEPATFGL